MSVDVRIGAVRVVRMGELALSATPGEQLLAIGLGSCVAVALLDRFAGVAALAHVMLPRAPAGADVAAGKYGDRAVPELVAALQASGARRHRLEAVLAGGAQMFDRPLGGGMEIGARNADAVLAALEHERIPVRARQLGGACGRTVRVLAQPPRVTVKQAGGSEQELWAGRQSRRQSTAEVSD